MDSVNEALKIIMGGKTGGYYLAGFFFSFLAILLSLYHSSKKRDPTSTSTPEKFSWTFLLWDNFKRITMSLVVIFILFRSFNLTNIFAMIGVGFFVAMGLDKAIEFIMERTDLMNFLQPKRKQL